MLLATFGALPLLGCGKDTSEKTVASESMDGKSIYNNYCGACHDTGVDDAPRLGEQAAWADRAPKWSALLKDHATKGFIDMKPMGGMLVLSEEAVVAAVGYMAEQIKLAESAGVPEPD